MGGILEAVGIPGFLDNETELYDRVVSKNDLLVDFVKAWWEKQQLKTGDDPSLSSYELFRLASYAETDADATLGEWRNLLGEMLGDGKPRSRQTKLGRILNDYQDKIIAGYKIRLSKTANGMKYWHLESTIQVGSTIGSTNDLQVVEQLLVEPVEPNSPYPVRENKFFSTQKIVYQNGEEKNNNFYRELGETGSTGSTQKEESCGSICGSGLVEPGRTYGEVLPGSTEQRLPLPVAKWITGLGSYAEAQQAQKALSGQWQTASGKDGDGFFVKCPNWQTIVTTVSSKEG